MLPEKTTQQAKCSQKFQKICDTCHIAQIEDTLNSMYICQQCGNCIFGLIDSENTSYMNNPLIEIPTFSYRRYDHFVEWLNKFHNIEKSKVPEKIFSIIKLELDKLHIDYLKINQHNILSILKKSGHSKYNSQIVQIVNVIKNKKNPKLPKHIEYKLKVMFLQTQKPFTKNCPNNRRNFLSYAYVIRKFLELLKQYKYIKYFPLLKSKEKLYNQDVIWKSMCNELKWKYYPSI
jgi:hypothetical protein